jgi:hypothetical protein
MCIGSTKHVSGIRDISRIIRMRFTSIEILSIKPMFVSKKTLNTILSICTELRILQIICPKTAINSKNAVRATMLEQIDIGKRLKGMRIGYLDCKVSEIGYIKHLADLKHLDIISGNYKVRDLVHAISLHCKHLKSLTLGVDSRIAEDDRSLSGNDIIKLCKCSNLKYLKMKKCLLDVTHLDIKNLIIKLKNLVTLRLSHSANFNAHLYSREFLKSISDDNTSLKELELKSEKLPDNISCETIRLITSRLLFNFWSHRLHGKIYKIYHFKNSTFYLYRFLHCTLLCVQKLLLKMHAIEKIKRLINDKIIGSYFDKCFVSNQRYFKFFINENEEYKNLIFEKYNTIYVWLMISLVLEYYYCIKNKCRNLANCHFGTCMDILISTLMGKIEKINLVSTENFHNDFLLSLATIRKLLNDILETPIRY